MTRKIYWLSLPVTLLALGGASFAVQRSAPSPRVVTVSAKPPAQVASTSVLSRRVEDPGSPAYRAWLSELAEQNLEVDGVLAALNSDLTATQKNALLKAYLRGLPSGNLPQPEKWRAFLTAATVSADLSSDLALTLGRMLAGLGTDAELKGLEDVFAELGADLPNGNKLAVVAASKNATFVDTVLNDAEQPLEVRDQAVERAAALGNVDSLRKLTSSDSTADPTLKVSALRGLAATAQTTDELAEVMKTSKASGQADSYGRQPFNVAGVGVAEANVTGKAAILFGAWAETLQASRDAAEPSALSRGLVLGKSLARAFWTDDAASVGELIERGLAPLLGVVLDADRKAGRWGTVQLVAEFASDLRFECSMRPTPACTDPADPRSSFRERLASAVVPALAGTELEFYTAQLSR